MVPATTVPPGECPLSESDASPTSESSQYKQQSSESAVVPGTPDLSTVPVFPAALKPSASHSAPASVIDLGSSTINRSYSVKSNKGDEQDRRSIVALLSFQDDPLIKYAPKKANDAFHALFPGLSQDDLLVSDYSCAWQKDIPYQGKIYISDHHISFYANILSWIHEVYSKSLQKLILLEQIAIPVKDITAIEKRNYVGIIPNAIEIQCGESKFFFASFLQRDSAYETMMRAWKNPMTQDHVPLISLGRSVRELGMNSAQHDGDDVTPNQTEGRQETAGDMREQILKAESELVLDKDVIGDTMEMRKRNGTSATSDRGLGDLASPGTDNGSSKAVYLVESKVQDGKIANIIQKGNLIEGFKTNGTTSPATSSPSAAFKRQKQQEVERPKKKCSCTEHSKMTLLMDQVFPTTVQDIWGKMFGNKSAANGFWRRFTAGIQQCTDIKASTWIEPGKDVQAQGFDVDDNVEDLSLERIQVGMSRKTATVVPLNNPLGPRQTRCNTVEQVVSKDQASNEVGFVCVRGVSNTPDVPAGAQFQTVVLVCISDEGGTVPQTRVRVSGMAEFTRFSLLQSTFIQLIEGFITGAVPEQMKEHYKKMNDMLRKDLAIELALQSQAATPADVPQQKNQEEEKLSTKEETKALVQPQHTLAHSAPTDTRLITALYCLSGAIVLLTFTSLINIYFLISLINVYSKK